MSTFASQHFPFASFALFYWVLQKKVSLFYCYDTENIFESSIYFHMKLVLFDRDKRYGAKCIMSCY